MVAKQVGRDNWQRTVYSALAEDVPAQRLLAGETLNPPGNWSSYPPHKHDRLNPPQEAVLEEVYFFRIKPAQGFGLMWTYTAPATPMVSPRLWWWKTGIPSSCPKVIILSWRRRATSFTTPGSSLERNAVTAPGLTTRATLG